MGTWARAGRISSPGTWAGRCGRAAVGGGGAGGAPAPRELRGLAGSGTARSMSPGCHRVRLLASAAGHGIGVVPARIPGHASGSSADASPGTRDRSHHRVRSGSFGGCIPGLEPGGREDPRARVGGGGTSIPGTARGARSSGSPGQRRMGLRGIGRTVDRVAAPGKRDR